MGSDVMLQKTGNSSCPSWSGSGMCQPLPPPWFRTSGQVLGAAIAAEGETWKYVFMWGIIDIWQSKVWIIRNGVMNFPHYWPFLKEFTGSWWIPSQRSCHAIISCFVWCVSLHELLNTQSTCWWFETLWRSCDVTVMSQPKSVMISDEILSVGDIFWSKKAFKIINSQRTVTEKHNRICLFSRFCVCGWQTICRQSWDQVEVLHISVFEWLTLALDDASGIFTIAGDWPYNPWNNSIGCTSLYAITVIGDITVDQVLITRCLQRFAIRRQPTYMFEMCIFLYRIHHTPTHILPMKWYFTLLLSIRTHLQLRRQTLAADGKLMFLDTWLKTARISRAGWKVAYKFSIFFDNGRLISITTFIEVLTILYLESICHLSGRPFNVYSLFH